jgi:hypothetical protein
VVGKSGWMARDNLFISLFGTLAPHPGLIQVVGFRKHSRELHRIVGIVGNGGEAAKPCDRAIALAEFIFNLGQMAFGLCIGWQPSPCGFKPVPGAFEITMPQPHVAALKLKLRNRKRRDASEAPAAFVEPSLSSRNLPKFSMEGGKSSQAFEIGAALSRRPSKRQRFVISPDCLQNRCPFGLYLGTRRAKVLGAVEIG